MLPTVARKVVGATATQPSVGGCRRVNLSQTECRARGGGSMQAFCSVVINVRKVYF